MRIAHFCIMAERTKHIHAQCLFRFLAARHKTFAKLLISETTGHRPTLSPGNRWRTVGTRLSKRPDRNPDCYNPLDRVL